MIDDVEIVEMLAKAAERGELMTKIALQFHDLVINASKDRIKRAHMKKASALPVGLKIPPAKVGLSTVGSSTKAAPGPASMPAQAMSH